MPAPAPDFRLYHSNALDVLAELLASELRQPAPGQSLLSPDVVLIPQVAMRRWLQATLAQRYGVAANLEFLTPGEFVRRALDANVSGDADDLDAMTLQWRLYAALADARFVEQPALRALREHLGAGDALRAWTLAGELGAVFEKYQAWRRDWLLRWEAGAEPQDPQAILWRAVAAGRDHRSRRLQTYLSRHADGDTLPVGLPSRLFAFATLNVSPDVLRVMATQARTGVLHFYLPTPTRAYWGDLQSLGARLRNGAPAPFGEDADENPLLRAWGGAGRDFMALLGSYEVVHPSGEFAAYADPEQSAGRTLAESGLRDSLLHRLQADLFHRRPTPSEPLIAQVNRHDPSVQVHACHTRLRELQVLHDRLRALLEDDRFDPPLQPREIAVLAPDIDPYVPYLDAVFGSHGQEDPIPYAMADASPLAGEPLAEVFLRLLDLPIARFGLEEVLDLLASPPLAQAAGLDAAAFERLQGWLHAAGARWGLDARHRERQGAPADDAYTWQFALDRLLLGHATGSDALIHTGHGHVIAPWPELEGSALDALDRLLRLLRVLARHERVLGTAMTPADWRERLLALLDALLPDIPASGGTQRALDRLRRLIDDFANDAARSEVELPMPAEVVRTHFASALSESDTRAPLLTGGVSFARMVPMRLLPFRVICLLGMNDGEFPRRDPAAGLNRLTADLDTAQRRHGDRSTRDDDRYLFLQLFCSAQEVFYLSWLGADPRDGSVREPSALVSELLSAAAAYHVPASDPRRREQLARAAQTLVLRHPLQPFAPVAFGASEDHSADPRRFSYRGNWHPAAGRLAGQRMPLAPWMDASALAAVDSGDSLSLDELRRFLMAPAEQFLRQRLGMRLAEVEAAGEDIEPLRAPDRGRERNILQRAIFQAVVAGESTDALAPGLRARGLLPSGALGLRALAEVLEQVHPYATRFAQWQTGAAPRSLLVEVSIEGLRLHGQLTDIWPQGLARLRFDAPNGPSTIRHGLDWLLAEAADIALPFVEFHNADHAGLGPHLRQPIGREAASAALAQLLALRREGLRRPLPFAPYSGWKLYAAKTPASGMKAAAEKWLGRDGDLQGWAEGNTEAMRLALRGRDPFSDPLAHREFARLSHAIFGWLLTGQAGEPPEYSFEAQDSDDAEEPA